jgi:hypothetical protein
MSCCYKWKKRVNKKGNSVTPPRHNNFSIYGTQLYRSTISLAGPRVGPAITTTNRIIDQRSRPKLSAPILHTNGKLASMIVELLVASFCFSCTFWFANYRSFLHVTDSTFAVLLKIYLHTNRRQENRSTKFVNHFVKSWTATYRSIWLEEIDKEAYGELKVFFHFCLGRAKNCQKATVVFY